MWLNIAIGLIAVILSAAVVGLLIGESAAEFYIPNFIERTLAGSIPIGLALGLFFGLRTLARMALRRIGLFDRLLWLDITIGLFVVILWVATVQLILDESGVDIVRFLKGILIAAGMLGGALGIFFGLRALVYMGLQRISPAMKQRTGATCASD